MLTGKWVTVNMRDRKKLKDLVKQHGNMEVVAKLIGVSEGTLNGWMDKETVSRFRSGARDRLKILLQPPPMMAAIRETVFQDESVLDILIKKRDALNIVIDMLQGDL